MSARKNLLAGALLLLGSAVLAAEDKLPDEDFLEYLGSWEESDEDWLMFEKESKKRRKDDDSEPEDEESAETEDES